jgi:hypothetical protein
MNPAPPEPMASLWGLSDRLADCYPLPKRNAGFAPPLLPPEPRIACCSLQEATLSHRALAWQALMHALLWALYVSHCTSGGRLERGERPGARVCCAHGTAMAFLIRTPFLTALQGSVAEWSKALVLGTSLFGGVGSNPTTAKKF